MIFVRHLSKKHQTTIPREVRLALGLRAGDAIEFVVDNGRVSLVKASKDGLDETAFRLARTDSFRDWDTPEDDAAFGDL